MPLSTAEATAARALWDAGVGSRVIAATLAVARVATLDPAELVTEHTSVLANLEAYMVDYGRSGAYDDVASQPPPPPEE